jgi:hypothetical protein
VEDKVEVVEDVPEAEVVESVSATTISTSTSRSTSRAPSSSSTTCQSVRSGSCLILRSLNRQGTKERHLGGLAMLRSDGAD